MKRRTNSNPHSNARRRRFEQLERRDLLAGEILSFKPDATQDGQSLLDSNRSFTVEVGERFDLELQFDDLRSPFAREGTFGEAVNGNIANEPPPFQNPVNRFDVDGDGQSGSAGALLRDFNTLQRELSERNVSDAITGKLPDNPTLPVAAFFDVNGDGFASELDTEELLLSINPDGRDWGDAPDSYQTQFSQNGARHLLSGAFLGALRDAEDDGLASSDGLGDDQSESDDEDGVTFNSAIATGASAGLDVVASGQGILDAWIDWNADGDWNDSGEHVIDGVTLNAGSNSLSVIVPGAAELGNTFARFRFSDAGSSTPFGFATNGEVEDYLITIFNATGSSDVDVNVSGAASVQRDGGDLVVSAEASELSRTAITATETLNLIGSDSPDDVALDFSGGNIVPSGGLVANGGGGSNTLRVNGDGATFDLTGSGTVDAQNFDTLDLSDTNVALIIIDAAAIARLAPSNKSVAVKLQNNVDTSRDRIVFSDETDWRMTAPILVGVDFTLTATHRISGEELQVTTPRLWQNVIQASDINNDGAVTSNDALRLINELGRRDFSRSSQNGELLQDLAVSAWPDVYFDQNGDDKATALDALRVINELVRVSPPSSGEQIQQAIPPGRVDAAFSSPMTTTDPPGSLVDQIRSLHDWAQRRATQPSPTGQQTLSSDIERSDAEESDAEESNPEIRPDHEEFNDDLLDTSLLMARSSL